MDREFKKFNSIENSYQEGFMSKVRELLLYEPPEKNSWLVTEKIHGCNSQISYDGNTIMYGKRTGFVEDGDNFYNIRKVLAPLEPAIKEMFNDARWIIGLKEIIIFGELFGGGYACPGVERDTKASRVQKGVEYTPHNEFMAFDICAKIGDKYQYATGKQFLGICEQYGVKHVPVLKRDITLDEALEFPNDKLSYVYRAYDLPPIEGNVMEGVVIRGYLKDFTFGEHRAIIKNKNDKFKEKTHEKKRIYTPKEFSDNAKEVLEDMAEYITRQRVENIISHHGEITMKDMGKILGETQKEVVDEYLKEHKDDNKLSLIEKTENKLLFKKIGCLVREVVYPVVCERANYE